MIPPLFSFRSTCLPLNTFAWVVEELVEGRALALLDRVVVQQPGTMKNTIIVIFFVFLHRFIKGALKKEKEHCIFTYIHKIKTPKLIIYVACSSISIKLPVSSEGGVVGIDARLGENVLGVEHLGHGEAVAEPLVQSR